MHPTHYARCIQDRFKKGAASWNVQGILGAMCRFLKDSPARRGQYEKCNKNDDAAQQIYPLAFFTWVENKPVASRALDCIDNFNAYMEWWGKQPPSKKPKNNHSFDTLATHQKEKFLEVRIPFFS